MKKSPSASPPSTPMTNGNGFTNGSATTESLDRLSKPNMKPSTSKINNFFQRFSKEQPANDAQNKSTKRTIKLSGNSTTSSGTNAQLQPQSVLKVPTSNSLSASTNASTKRPSNTGGRRSFLEADADLADQQTNDYEHDEIRAINEHVHEYYFAVRILPGQNPRSVFVGWVTSRSSRSFSKRISRKTAPCQRINWTNSFDAARSRRPARTDRSWKVPVDATRTCSAPTICSATQPKQSRLPDAWSMAY